MKAKTRNVPHHYSKVVSIPEFGIEVFSYCNGSCFAQGFSGKRTTPDFHYTFKTAAAAQVYIEGYVTNIQKAITNKAEVMAIRKKERKEKQVSEYIKLGDLFHYSWGYEQTQCEFFQVTKVGKATIELTPITSKMTKATSSMSCYLIPCKNKFSVSEYNPILKNKRIAGSPATPYIKMRSGYAYPVAENEEKYCSWYA